MPTGSKPIGTDEPDRDRGPVSEATAVQFTLITDADGLARVTAVIADHGGPVGLDTETTGLNPVRDRVRLIQLAVGSDTFLIDVFAFPDPAADVADLFEILSRVEVIGHNLASFDLPFLARLGFHPKRVFDTLLASKVLHGGDDVGHGLADAAQRELGVILDKSHQTDDWAGTITKSMLEYAAADAAVLVPLAVALTRKADVAGLTPVLDLEMRAAVPVARMAATGVGFDPVPWLDAAVAAAADRDRLRAELDTMAPNPACLPGIASRNWNSRDQVLDALSAAGLDAPDTTEETLAGLDHPLAAKILAFRGADKAAGTYGRDWVDRHVTGGRVFATWKPYGARTGRMSCGDPNLQQVPRGAAYRRSFVALPGHVLVKADYSQVELRIAAKVTGDARMLAAYRDGLDLHALTAARFLGVPAADVPKAARQTAKPVNFGAIYGLSPKSLKRKAKAEYGLDLTDREAGGFLDAFFREYPGVRAWHDRLKRDEPTVVTTLGGRRVAVPATAFHGTRANYVVQGTGGDGLKRALVLLWERRAAVPDARVVLAVHDEVVVEVPEPQAELAAAWLTRAMLDAMAPLIAPVPVVVEPAIGRTWGG